MTDDRSDYGDYRPGPNHPLVVQISRFADDVGRSDDVEISQQAHEVRKAALLVENLLLELGWIPCPRCGKSAGQD